MERVPVPPTQPGCYWWKRDGESREIMVQVRLTNGELTAWWPNQVLLTEKCEFTI